MKIVEKYCLIPCQSREEIISNSNELTVNQMDFFFFQKRETVYGQQQRQVH